MGFRLGKFVGFFGDFQTDSNVVVCQFVGLLEWKLEWCMLGYLEELIWSTVFQTYGYLPNYLSVAGLTRFNKIATQGAPQMAVDKEANSLSRVYSYYSKFNLCLFYV